MKPNLYNTPELGKGIYTPPDISLILNIPAKRIRWYVNEVWDNRFGMKLFNERYSWNIQNQKAVNFLVVIELKVVFILRKLGIPTRKILVARSSIAKENNLAYPFAASHLLANSHQIWYRVGEDVVNADGSSQLNFPQLVEKYCKSIDFGSNHLAERFWPNGKTSSIVVDPGHQFGQPTIHGTNIKASTIYSMIKSGESRSILSELYNISGTQIEDVVRFYNQAA